MSALFFLLLLLSPFQFLATNCPDALTVGDCADCNADGTKCVTCRTGLFLSKNSLYCCSSSVTNCNDCERGSLAVCTGCSVGTINVNKSLCCAVVNCADCSQSAQCTTCKSGYRLSSDHLFCCDLKVIDSNCIRCNGNNNCLQCSTGFRMSPEQPVALILILHALTVQ